MLESDSLSHKSKIIDGSRKNYLNVSIMTLGLKCTGVFMQTPLFMSIKCH